ncbi:hypothetical protein GGR22_000241 [Flavobacterium gossypii]|jgi:hypothetical protein|uniref:Uncharacterized protein n=2 Tax=Flavobacterium TaxID=237 RepID=A0A495MJW2_9FLAO|nr:MULTISPECIES: hypothetical protein [Flavobacterium]MBA9072115.1 hypothetical protein [Flavobacterium gossypii]RKS25163.1 hypothetical protein CLV94_0193 [Flavobacterium endophyticum]
MTEQVQIKTASDKKQKQLMLSLLFDAIGMFSYALPFLGEFADFAWAPISGFILARMYKGTVGTVGGIISFLEELFPFTDILPTFTLTWIYTYYFSKEKK